ncbi:MAG: peptidoglycan-binding domain-containing protein [Clostridia bacterium]|nr:peptidoglycan-binding domain-containing protein [Clostridia bacterium]
MAFIFILMSSGFSSGQDELIAQGSKGDKVVRLQQRLFDLGYYTYKPTGSFQVVTRNAVIAFQQRAGIMSDGTIGSETEELIFSNAAPRPVFSPVIPITYTARTTYQLSGTAMEWFTVRSYLNPETVYVVTDAYSGESANLRFLEGAYHAEMQPATEADRRIISGWLGSANSFYKCAVVITIQNRAVAASIQWNGNNLCVYFSESHSHVAGLDDVEHNALVSAVTRP